MAASSIYSILTKTENAHNDTIYCCAWSKSNLKDSIVTGGQDGLVKVWSLENNKLELLHTLKGHFMAVVSVAISPDGYTLASSSLGSVLIIWDLSTGQKVHDIKTGATSLWKVIISPNGMQVATAGHMGVIIVFDIKKGTIDKVLNTRGKVALSVAWSLDGKYIASGSVDGTVYIFDVTQGKNIHTIQAHTQAVRSVAFSPKSQLMATASSDGKLKIYDVASACLQHTLDHKCWVVHVVFSGDGSRIATAAADGSVRVILLEDFALHHTFREHTDAAWSVDFNGVNNKLVSVSVDKYINIYECPIPPKTVPKKEYTLTKYHRLSFIPFNIIIIIYQTKSGCQPYRID